MTYFGQEDINNEFVDYYDQAESIKETFCFLSLDPSFSVVI